jgi:hypothetical protein
MSGLNPEVTCDCSDVEKTWQATRFRGLGHSAFPLSGPRLTYVPRDARIGTRDFRRWRASNGPLVVRETTFAPLPGRVPEARQRDLRTAC